MCPCQLVKLHASVNRHGDIVTFRGTEYRMRDDVFLLRNENGNLERIEWVDMPQEVRNAFTECTR